MILCPICSGECRGHAGTLAYDDDALFEFADIATFSKLPVRTGLQPKEIAEFAGSTWIVKHDPIDVAHASLNEWMTMQLVSAAGFETAEYGLSFIESGKDRRAALFVKHFDFLGDFTQHLVSGLQLVHESPTYAYRIESVLEDSTPEEFNIVYDSMLREMTLFEAVDIFNEAGVTNMDEVFKFYVAAELLNHNDCHLGNIGFVRNLETGEFRVSPVYDVGNFGVYDEARTILPTANDAHNLDRVALELLAKKCGVGDWELVVEGMADKITAAMPDIIKAARNTAWIHKIHLPEHRDLRGPGDLDDFLEKYETTARKAIMDLLNRTLDSKRRCTKFGKFGAELAGGTISLGFTQPLLQNELSAYRKGLCNSPTSRKKKKI